MDRRLVFPLVFGILGTAILVSLGMWQLQRLHWKTALLAEIDARMTRPPVALPQDPDPARDKYLHVTLSGVIAPRELHVLTSGEGGPGFKVISAMVLPDGRRILLDRGFIPESARDTPRRGGQAEITGVLVWPDETDSFVPAPNLDKNIWFARDVALMAETLDTAPVMVAAAENSNPEGITPQRASVNIFNRHLEYVMTWFSLAIIWIGMTGYAIWRIKRQTK